MLDVFAPFDGDALFHGQVLELRAVRIVDFDTDFRAQYADNRVAGHGTAAFGKMHHQAGFLANLQGHFIFAVGLYVLVEHGEEPKRVRFLGRGFAIV